MNLKPVLLSAIHLANVCLLLCLLHYCEGVTNAEERTKVTTLDLEPVDAQRQRTVPLRIYLPSEQAERPVILYSHGLGGSRLMKSYLGKQWSSAGFACVFMQHAGSDSEVWKGEKPRNMFQTLKAAANFEQCVARVNDVSFVIDQLEVWAKQPDHPLHQRLDLEHLGMSGHSFGSVTTLMVAGQLYPLNKTLIEPRIDAFLAMSPQPGQGLSAERTFRELKKPVFCMTGTNDDSPINPRVTPKSRASVFTALPPKDKYQVVFDGGHHFTFSGGEGRMAKQQNPKHHRAIETLSTKFWQAYLNNDDAAKAWLQSNQPRTENILDAADHWEWK